MNVINRLTFHSAFSGLYYGIFLAVQTLFLLDKGFALWQIGVLFGTYGVSAALFELPLGALADLQGRIKVFKLHLMATCAGFAAAFFVTDFYLLLVGMVVLGLGRALQSGTIDSWQVEQINKMGLTNKLGQLIGRFQAVGAIAMAVGALTGGYLPGLAIQLFPTMIPSALNLLVIAAFVFTHLLLTPWLFSEGDTPFEHEETPSVGRQIRIALTHGYKNQTLRSLFIVAALLGFTLMNIEAYWQPFVKYMNVSEGYDVFGWLAMGYFAGAAIGPALYSLLLGKMTASSESQITVILAFSALCLYLLANQTTLMGFAVFYIAFMAVFSSINIPLEVLLNEHTNDHIRSTIHSVISLLIVSGGAIASFGLAPVVQWIGIAAVWKIVSIVLTATVAWLLLFNTFYKKDAVTLKPSA